MNAAEQLAPTIGVTAVCAGLGVSRASYYCKQNPSKTQSPNPSSNQNLPVP